MLINFLIKFIINKFICLVNIPTLLTVMLGGFIVNIVFLILILLVSNIGNVILNGNHQFYNVIVTAHGLFIFVPFTFNEFENFFFPNFIGAIDMAFFLMNNLSFWFLPPSLFLLITSLFVKIDVGLAILLFLRCVNKKIKFSFYPLIGFFIITLLTGNFSYASSDDLPLPNDGNPIGGIIIVVFFMLIAFIGTYSNLDNSKSSSLPSTELDLKDIDKMIIESSSINENKIPNENLLDDIPNNKFIISGIFIYSLCVMLFVIHQYLYPKYIKKISKIVTYIKNLIKK